MSTIPASLFAEMTPSVLSASGDAVQATCLMLTTNTMGPIGTVASFSSAAAVATFFGATSNEAVEAGVYFAGYQNQTALPATLKVAQYPLAAVSAYVRGGSMAGVSLTTLQGYNATLSVTIDGILKSASINLASATSFSNAAEIIANALGIEGVQAAHVTASISGTTMTVTAVSSGTLGIGDVISGSGVTANTYITAFGTGSGGTGTYTVSASQTVGSETITAFTPAVQFDSVSSAFIILSGTTGTTSTITYGSEAMATDLLLTQATGAVLSQGANAATPSAFMTGLVAVDADWVTFMTLFDPDGGSGNAQRQLFAAWNTLQNDQYVYVCWDTDATAPASVPATASLGYILKNNGNSGTCLVWEPSNEHLAAFVCGMVAAINFNAVNGRITAAFKSQAGLVAGVTTQTAAVNLGGNPQVVGDFGNGYNYYGAVGAANAGFLWFQRGTITGPFKWLDSYVNQVVMNSAFQNALLNFFANTNSIPFDDAGATLIEQALSPTIQQYGDPAKGGFGAFAPGTISQAQVAEVNAQAGANVAPTLQAQGYYLQVVVPSSTIRSNRGPWPVTFWYLDRGSVQSISLSSVAVE